MAEQARGRVRAERGVKRVRAYLDGDLVADTRAPLLVWEVPYYPAYYVPASDVRAELVASGHTAHSPSRGEAGVFDVKTSRSTAPGAAQRYDASPIDALPGHVRLQWDAFSWFEEDEPVFVHPRNPYTRIDILGSSRDVRIEVDGVTVADSSQPRVLFETGLPPRYYLPMTDVRLDLLRPSETITHCPYKGTASYYSVEVNGHVTPDVVWYYPTPLPESQKVQGLACFYDEKVDVFLDGEQQTRPKTKFA
ncbi:MAG TPA: DUF427 domain-containing protein [Frankiaceae bacterium]|nr:DUF427 domain-containing protein [Frankiaceae bacterium]